MRFKTETIDDVTIVKMMENTIDAGNVMEFKADILPIIQASQKVAVDMGRLKFMDSSGIGAIFSCMRALHEKNGELKLFNVRSQILQLFKLVRLDRIIEILENKKAAVSAFQKRSLGNG